MNNFGVIEVASAKTTSAPGWAYVPDTGVNPSVAALQPSSRKRAARSGPNLSLSDLSARQEAKIRKELEALDKDSHRDTNIQIPAKSGGSRPQTKHTPNVRKILQSQKTFANHLDDFQAMLALAENNPSANPSNPPRTSTPAASSSGKRPPPKAASKAAKADADRDTDMADAPPPVLPPYTKAPPTAHQGDTDPLLISRVPDMPSDEELRALLAVPPLNYIEARAGWTEEDRKYPIRHFCEVCGYWGRVKCMKCGTRVCALECLEMHREECVTRYGL